MNDQVGGRAVRRRRSWYKRRMRMQRGLITAVMLALLTGVCWQSAARFFRAAPWRNSQPLPQSASTRGSVHADLSSLAAHTSRSAHPPTQKRGVYPYSVVPGGVEGPDDLRRATQHDHVVWQHYARFQYEHARLVRATQARQVYLSYRLRDHIFWTRKRVHLHVGELLFTDGNITARARCGNQISETPRPDVSEEEPAEDVFDKPVAGLEPMPPALPIRSSLVPPSLPGVNPLQREERETLRSSPQASRGARAFDAGADRFRAGGGLLAIPPDRPRPPGLAAAPSRQLTIGSTTSGVRLDTPLLLNSC